MKKNTEYAKELLDLVNNGYGSLSELTEVDLSLEKTPDGKWNKKQILGHLIDSASNNHQRFIRSQLGSELVFPAFQQDEWVEIQDYKNAKWKHLLELWKFYNYHLAGILKQMPKDVMERKMIIGPYEPITLRGLIESYIEHLNHHLKQLITPK